MVRVAAGAALAGFLCCGVAQESRAVLIEPLPLIVATGLSEIFGEPEKVFLTTIDKDQGELLLGACTLQWSKAELGGNTGLQMELECPRKRWLALGLGKQLEGSEVVLAVPERNVETVRLGSELNVNALNTFEKVPMGDPFTRLSQFRTRNGVATSTVAFSTASIGSTLLFRLSDAVSSSPTTSPISLGSDSSTATPTPLVDDSPNTGGLPFIMAVGTSGTFGEPANVFTTALSTQEGKEEFEGGCVLEWAKSQVGSSPGLKVSFECPSLHWLACGLGEELEGAEVVLAAPNRAVDTLRLGSEISEDALANYEKVTMGSSFSRAASFENLDAFSSSRLEFSAAFIGDTPLSGFVSSAPSDEESFSSAGLIVAGIVCFAGASALIALIVRKRQAQSSAETSVAAKVDTADAYLR